MIEKKKVLVIIVTYNAMEWIDRCLQSINDSEGFVDTYVIDNGSSDGTQQHIKTVYPHVYFVQSQENLGFGKANNIGFRHAIENNYEYVYLLNQDAWVFEDTLRTMVDVMESNPDYATLSPMQISASGKIDFSFVANCCSEMACPGLISDIFNGQLKDLYTVTKTMAAHWLIPVRVLRKVGGFSPSFPHYGEDNDFQNRTVFFGYKNGICPTVKAVHDREYRQETIDRELYFYYIRYIRILSNINISLHKAFCSILKEWLHNLEYRLKKRALFHKHYLIRFLFSMKSIVRNRKIAQSSLEYKFL